MIVDDKIHIHEVTLIIDADLKELKPRPPTCSASTEHVQSGVPIPKAVRVRTFSPEDWEEFIEEWATSLADAYEKVRRFGGAGDLGVDIAGFCTDQGFQGAWDNYQCKRYAHPLRPSDVWVEIGKIIYYSFLGEYVPPRKHYFVCSQGIGTTLEQLLNNSKALKAKAADSWTSIVAPILLRPQKFRCPARWLPFLIALISAYSLQNRWWS